MFSNVWAVYTRDLGYTPPTSASTGATSLVGDPCIGSDDCALPSPICAAGSGYPGGLCTTKCTDSCPTVDAFCSDFTSGGFCLAVCSPTDSFSCRSGYSCTSVQGHGSDAGSANVCTPTSQCQ